MKKYRIVPILSAALALTLLFSLSGCGKKKAANAKTSASDTTSVTPQPPVIGGPDASLMGPLYYSDPQEADSAGLTSPVIRPPEPTPESADAQGGANEETQGAADNDAQGAGASDAESVDAAQTSTGAGMSDAFAASDAYKQGYAAGEAAGYAQGYKAGYDEGGGVGYDNGYKAGRTAGYAEIAGIVTSRIADNTD